MTRAGDSFAMGGLVWHQRWAVGPGEHPNAGRYVWEAMKAFRGHPDLLLAVWCERRWFDVVRNVRGVEIKSQRAEYRAAVDGQLLRGAWPSILPAMDAASVAAVQDVIREARSA